jgi:membrane peptidoglycan carboxypeptidase
VSSSPRTVTTRSPATGPPPAARQQYVLAAMVRSGDITPAQQARAAAEHLQFAGLAAPNGCAAAAGGAAGCGLLLRLPAAVVGQPAGVRVHGGAT